MSLREAVELYSKLTGKDGTQESIVRIGAYLDGYEKGKEDAEPHWIPVTEDTPDEERECWITPKTTSKVYRGVFTRHYGKCHRTGFICVEGFMWLNSALAWMYCELPEPYKGGDGMSRELKPCPFRIHGERTASLTVAGEYFYNETFMPCMGKECACFTENSIDAYCDRNGAFMTMTKEVTE